MNPSVVIKVVFALTLLLGGYALGFYRAKQEMDAFAGNLVSGVSAGIRGESISLLLSTAEAMPYPNQAVARKALLQYARSQALAVKECSSNTACASLPAQPLPHAALVERALGYK